MITKYGFTELYKIKQIVLIVFRSVVANKYVRTFQLSRILMLVLFSQCRADASIAARDNDCIGSLAALLKRE